MQKIRKQMPWREVFKGGNCIVWPCRHTKVWGLTSPRFQMNALRKEIDGTFIHKFTKRGFG